MTISLKVPLDFILTPCKIKKCAKSHDFIWPHGTTCFDRFSEVFYAMMSPILTSLSISYFFFSSKKSELNNKLVWTTLPSWRGNCFSRSINTSLLLQTWWLSLLITIFNSNSRTRRRTSFLPFYLSYIYYTLVASATTYQQGALLEPSNRGHCYNLPTGDSVGPPPARCEVK